MLSKKSMHLTNGNDDKSMDSHHVNWGRESIHGIMEQWLHLSTLLTKWRSTRMGRSWIDGQSIMGWSNIFILGKLSDFNKLIKYSYLIPKIQRLSFPSRIFSLNSIPPSKKKINHSLGLQEEGFPSQISKIDKVWRIFPLRIFFPKRFFEIWF